MSVTFGNLTKAGLVGQNQAQVDKGSSGKDSEHENVFQALLNVLKPEEDATPVSGLRNRPATSQVITQARHGSAALPGARSATLNSQNVNCMAASALIAMTAISSGRNPVGVGGQGAGMPVGLAGLISNAAGISETNSIAGGNSPGQEIGALSERFESGGLGPGVVGYDPNGGTSYGIYQISSRAGTMKSFIDYLSERAPDIAQKLEAAGPANTGGRSGKMPHVWKELASADPVRFQKLQTSFIKENLYLPTVQEISDRTGVDISKAPQALQEVLWSTAVQHGSNGAANIFARAIGSVEKNSDQTGMGKMAKLIDTVYHIRATRFGSSGAGIRAAARSRFRQEGQIALAMLSKETMGA